MRKVIASPFTSQDGFMAGPDGDIEWNVPYFDDDMAAFLDQQLDETGALLYGRVTYQYFANYWPTAGMQDDPDHAGKLNALPKIVFSTTLERAEWNNSRLVRDDVAEEIARLKQEEGKPLVIDGSPTLIHSFTSLGLIDEFVIRLHPVVLGGGVPLFNQRVKLALLEARPLRSGVVILRYQPVNN